MAKFISFTFGQLVPGLVGALPVTLYMMLISLVFAFLLGSVLTFLRFRKNRVARGIAAAYITFIRCTPELAQLFLVYFGLPQILTPLGVDTSNMSPVVFAIITFSLNVSAYLSEVMRSAYLSVDRGQQEAAYSVGMTGSQAFGRIILPQMFGVALPNLGNTVIILFKDTSLAFTIGVIDVMGMGKVISARDYGVAQLEIYVVIAVVYWVICAALERGSMYLEKICKKGSKALT